MNLFRGLPIDYLRYSGNRSPNRFTDLFFHAVIVGVLILGVACGKKKEPSDVSDRGEKPRASDIAHEEGEEAADSSGLSLDAGLPVTETSYAGAGSKKEELDVNRLLQQQQQQLVEEAQARLAREAELETPRRRKRPNLEQKPLTPTQVGNARAGLVETPFETGVSPWSHGKYGDYRLGNNHVTLIFAHVENVPEPDAEREAPPKRAPRGQRPGALIDATVDGERVDFFWEFTQGLGSGLNDPVIAYETAEFVKRGHKAINPNSKIFGTLKALQPAVGLRLTGSSFEDEKTIVETTYWLEPNQTRVQIDSRIIAGDASQEIHDVANWGAGIVLADTEGPAQGGTGDIRDVQWYAAKGGSMSIASATFGGRIKGLFLGNTTRVHPYQGSQDNAKPLETRWLFIAPGNFSAATDQVFEMGAVERPYGLFRGKVYNPYTKKPAPGAWVTAFYYDRQIGIANRRIFSRIDTDAAGNFEAKLPAGRYFVTAQSQTRPWVKRGSGNQVIEVGIVIEPGGLYERDVYVTHPAQFEIQVSDAKTKKPIVARARMTAIPPTPVKYFQSIDRADGFLDSFYVPKKGASVELWEGNYTVTVTAGPRYDFYQYDIELKWGTTKRLEVELVETSPTPGWLGMEIGAMTRVTEGAALSAEDVVLMAAGEGIDWLVSGDWEKITDFAPTIEKMGLQDDLGSSLGFRTWLPAHPEWGGFMVYPVSADAPPPETARDQWKDLTEAKEFVATLRRLYPGALIESINPYTKYDGYFYAPDQNFAQMAFEDPQPVAIDHSIDAINIFKPRERWNVGNQKSFLFISTLKNRFYIPAPVSNARVALGSEPGYPRLLVRTGESNPSRVTEKQLVAAMKAGKWQLTTGPFIDFTVEGRRESEMLQPGQDRVAAKIKITAPNWCDISTIQIGKEGIADWKIISQQGTEKNVRMDREKTIKLNPHAKVGEDDQPADTELNMEAMGSNSDGLDPGVPSYGGTSAVPVIAISAPTFMDTNGNNKWDPPNFRDKGK